MSEHQIIGLSIAGAIILISTFLIIIKYIKRNKK